MLLCCSIAQLLPALDESNIAIQINDQLPSDTVYVRPYSGFYVDQLRKKQIETLQITVINNSSEPITISPTSITNLEVVSEKEAEDGLLGLPRFANVMIASVSLLIIAAAFGMRKYYPLTGKKRTLATILFGLGVFGLPLAGVFIKIEDYIWHQIAAESLFEPVTVLPGQTVKRYIFADKNKALPQTYVCTVVDNQGQTHTVNATKVSSIH